MWLLNTTTLRLHEFQSKPPPYAILSHTWGKEEVLFHEIGTSYCDDKAGFLKIKGCCAQAEADGLEYAWVDTCAIDKKSSAELSEAINSMFRWYSDAHVCYVYLEDIDIGYSTVPYSVPRDFEKSRWFSRAWTLQEILAPIDVVFYDKHWSEIGTKASLLDPIARTTGITRDALIDPTCIQRKSIAERMSWASERAATRVEDMAYSLMGIFDINMPLLYGEGHKAFRRLQLQILGQSNDHSLLAWDGKRIGAKDPIGLISPLNGVLASSPAAFVSSWYEKAEIRSSSGIGAESSISVTNLGLSVSLPLLRRHDGSLVAMLNCQRGGEKIGILLGSSDAYPDRYFRARSPATGAQLILVDEETVSQVEPPQPLYLCVDDPDPPSRVQYATTVSLMIKTTADFVDSGIVRRHIFRGGSSTAKDLVLYHSIDYGKPLVKLSLMISDGDWSMLVLTNSDGEQYSLLLGETRGRIWSLILRGGVSQDSWKRVEPAWREIQEALDSGTGLENYINDRAHYFMVNRSYFFCLDIKKGTDQNVWGVPVFNALLQQISRNSEHTKGRWMKSIGPENSLLGI